MKVISICYTLFHLLIKYVSVPVSFDKISISELLRNNFIFQINIYFEINMKYIAILSYISETFQKISQLNVRESSYSLMKISVYCMNDTS